MTHAEEIMWAICRLVSKRIIPFRRLDVRDEMGMSADAWQQRYTAIFQGMRDDHPGGAPIITQKYRNVITRVSYGHYILTTKGDSCCLMKNHDIDFSHCSESKLHQ